MRLNVILLILAVLCLVGTASGTDYYVSNDGADGNTGLSDAQAWENITKVNTINFANDDTINLKRGSTFTDATLTFDSTSVGRSGIIVQDYDSGAKPLIDGNSIQPIIIDHALINLTLRNLDISGSDTTGNRCHINGVNGLIIDGVDYNGHTGSTIYHRSNTINIGSVDGNIEIKNCTIQNVMKDTWENSVLSWGSLDAHAIIFWYANNAKISGVINVSNNTIHDIYADCVQTTCVQTQCNIYDNNFYNFGEQGVDHKKGRYINIYNNQMSSGGVVGNAASSCIGGGAGTLHCTDCVARDITVKDNYFYDTPTAGIAIGAQGMNNYKVYRNYFKDVGLAIQVSMGANTSIYNNVFELTALSDSSNTGVELSAIRVMYSAQSDLSIYNNIIYVSSSNHLYGIVVEADADVTGTMIKNNIIYMARDSASVFPLRIYDHDDSGNLPTVQYNILYGIHSNRVYIEETPGSWVTYDSTEQADWRTAGHTGALFTNPNLTNPSNGDLTLQSNSPAINAGTDLGSPYDFGLDYSSFWPDSVLTLNQSLYGSGWEIGAYVYDPNLQSPNITSWQNNNTSDSTLDITIDLDQNVKFNATANQTITTWDWEEDSIDQSNNYDNITLDWSIPGEYIITVTATNANGTSTAIQWNVTVDDSTTWGDTNYSYRKYIVFDDALIYGVNTNFSVLINTTDTYLANNTQSDGGDIKFMIDSTQMPHDLVDYNGTSGYIRAWVRMSELSDTNRLLHIYYGNATIANQWNATTTWQDYNLTFHMEGDPASGVLDSSGNANGTATGLTSADEVTGKIGNATNFDGTNDYIQITGLLGEPSNVTITAWINQTGTDTSGSSEVISLGDCLAIRLQPNWKAFYHHASGYNPIDTTDNLLDDGWTYIAVTVQPDDQRILKNAGIELTTETNTQVIDYTTKGTNTRVGSHGNAEVTYDFVGDIDEVRVTSLIRDADWIHTEYQNQDDPDAFSTYGTEESESGAPDTKFEFLDGITWKEDPDDWHFWFDCYWNTSGYPDGVAPNADQTESQHSLRVTNNGSAAGTANIKFNESSPSGITVYIDDDYTVAGATVITNIYQEIGPVLQPGENITLSTWVKLENRDSDWEFIAYVEVQ